MKTFKKISMWVGIVLVIFVVVSLFLPAKVHVERSMVMNSPPEVVYKEVATLKNWEKWSPWFQRDPQMKIKYEGPESGVGAMYSWDSENKEVGKGSMKVASVVPNESIIMDLDFGDHGKASGGYKFEKTDAGTKMTWSMDADNGMNPVKRYFGLLMDKMLAPDFEKGLNNIKTLCESMPKTLEMTKDSTATANNNEVVPEQK